MDHPDRVAALAEAGVDFTMKDIDRLSRRVPNICKVAPATQNYHIEDVHRAGGIFTILGSLERAGLLHRDVYTVHSETMGAAIDENDVRRPTATARAQHRALAAPGGVRTTLAFSQDKYFEGRDDDAQSGCIRAVEHAYTKEGGLAVLYGNIAQDGCIVKTAGVDESILTFSGPAVVVESQDDAVDAILSDRITPGDGDGELVITDHPPEEMHASIAQALGVEVGRLQLIVAVLAAVEAAGGDLGSAGLALAEMGGLKGRGARHRIPVPGGTALVIDESYNANPASMRATLGQLGATPASRRIAVLGSMKELGDFGPAFHAQLAGPIRDACVDYAVLVGEEMGPLAQELSNRGGSALGSGLHFDHCPDFSAAIAALEEFGLNGGDAVLVKGSNSVKLAGLVEHFTAREG